MNSLRARLIRLAATDAELRPVILPLLKEASSLLPRDEGVIAAWWSYKPKTGDLLMSDGKTLWLTVEGAKISVAVWDSRFKYTFTPITGFRLVDMVQEAVREWGINRPVVRQRIKNSPGIMLDGRVAMDDKTAFGRTTSRDETVIRRWWEHKAMEGDFLFSDGETLSGVWDDVVTPLAVWQGWGTFKMIPTLNAKKRQVQNEIRELAPGSDGPFALGGSDNMVENAMRLANSTTRNDLMATLRSRVIRLASANPELRPLLLPLLATPHMTKGASVGGKLVGNGWRLTWNDSEYELEELPAKGKKKLRVSTLRNPNYGARLGAWLPENIINFYGKVSASDPYDTVKDKIVSAITSEKVLTSAAKEARSGWDPWVLVKDLKWYENLVYFLNVVPENVDPFTAQGQGFSVKVGWMEFTSYSPSSDLQQADPHYTIIKSTAPASARKLYMLLKANPTALRSISWDNFDDWLKANKINYEYEFSVWR